MKTKKKKINKVIKHPGLSDLISLKRKSNLENACTVFEHTFESAGNFLSLYNNSRNGKSGTTTHPEQDLLRAMLLFACAGLDSTVKHLIEDNLNAIIEKDTNAQSQFEKYVETKLKKNRESIELSFNDNSLNLKLISEVIASSNPRNLLIKKLKKSLTDNSLQSLDQLLKVASSFAITSQEILTIKKPEDIKKTFDIRNEISHEMDVDLTGNSHKKRRERTCDDMINHVQNVLLIAFNFIKSVDSHLSK